MWLVSNNLQVCRTQSLLRFGAKVVNKPDRRAKVSRGAAPTATAAVASKHLQARFLIIQLPKEACSSDPELSAEEPEGNSQPGQPLEATISRPSTRFLGSFSPLFSALLPKG